MDEPTPDRKDWTWVLERPCPSCGYQADAQDRSDLGAAVRTNAARWRDLLSRKGLAGVRPPVPPGRPPVWSALEYGCHVRDVYARMYERLTRMLSEDEPTFADWDQDHAAIAGNYRQQDPAKVGYDLAVKAGQVADEIDRIEGPAWERVGVRSDGAQFTVESLIRYLLHDLTHHVWDVEQGYRALAEGTDEAREVEGSGEADGGPATNGASAP